MFTRWMKLTLLVVMLVGCSTIGPDHDESVFVRQTPTLKEDIDEQFSLNSGTLATMQIPGGETSPTATAMPATYYNFKPGINPLTGLSVPEPAILERRPVMVKVSN